MARPRSTPPSTPFGVWLDLWFKDNPGVTLEAFAGDIDVTKSAVSLWISATKPVQVKPSTLRLVARRTGAELEDLERMVYGATGAGERTSESAAVYDDRIVLSPDELQSMLNAAADQAVRRVMDEIERGGPVHRLHELGLDRLDGGGVDVTGALPHGHSPPRARCAPTMQRWARMKVMTVGPGDQSTGRPPSVASVRCVAAPRFK